MVQTGKLHKIIPIYWECTMFPLEIFTSALVGINIEKCDMQYVNPIFFPKYLLNNTIETVFHIDERANNSQA